MRKVLGDEGKTTSNLGREPSEQPRNFVPDWFRNLQNVIMEQKQGKYGSLKKRTDIDTLYQGLKLQLGKLKVAVEKANFDDMERRAAHIANYAMLIAMDTRKEPEGEASNVDLTDPEETKEQQEPRGKELPPEEKSIG